MTAIVGVRYKNGVVLAADSLATGGGGNKRERIDSKIVQFSDTVAMAGCGSPRVGQALEFGLEHFEGPYIGQDEYRWAVKELVPAIIHILDESGTLAIFHEDSILEMPDSALLFAVRHRLFSLLPDFQVAEDRVPWATEGSGGEVAAGSLMDSVGYDGNLTVLAAEKAAIDAVRVAIELNAYVADPIQVVRTSRLSADERQELKGLLK
jgi:20S proteasome alpha/beta subunit